MKQTLIEKLRQQTYDETVAMLHKTHKCCIIRPTGFGKTGILTKLLKNYKHVLYLYPTHVVWEAATHFYYSGTTKYDVTIPNVTPWTYSYLSRITDAKLDNLKDIDLIICDECHKLGGKMTQIAMHQLLTKFPNADLCGATATPDRMDLVNEVDIFFDNNVVSSYTLHDAFEDKILQKLYYCFTAYEYKSEIDVLRDKTNAEIEAMDDIDDALLKETAKKNIQRNLIQISNLVRMPNIIKTTCAECIRDTTYMKFIVFCASINHLNTVSSQVPNWFKSAFPNYNIRTLNISSENNKTHDAVNDLPTLCRTQNTIDLIFCCDMLNMGYHIDDLSGIIMYRGTKSGIIYMQQLGRVLSTSCKQSAVVFDIVGNINQESMYDVLGETPASTKKKQKRLQILRDAIIDNNDDADNPVCLSETELLEYKNLVQWEENIRTHNSYVLQPRDLIATSFYSEYKDLIAKTVAEPISMRCRQAYQNWIAHGGDESGGIESILKRELQFADTQPSENTIVPLSPFAYCKRVSIESVLRVIFGETSQYSNLIQAVMQRNIV